MTAGRAIYRARGRGEAGRRGTGGRKHRDRAEAAQAGPHPPHGGQRRPLLLWRGAHDPLARAERGPAGRVGPWGDLLATVAVVVHHNQVLLAIPPSAIILLLLLVPALDHDLLPFDGNPIVVLLHQHR